DGVVERGVEIALGAFLPGAQLVPELHVLAVEQLAAAEQVDGATLCRRHQPGARVVRDPGFRPAFEGRDQGVLREVLRRADVAGQARERGDELGRLDAPHRVDGAVRVGFFHGTKNSFRIYPPAIAPITRNGSVPAATASGSG